MAFFWRRNKIEDKLSRREMEFLPAALEIVETPPPPAGRLLMWVIMLFFVIALVWSIWGQVDEVAIAPGKVIPAGYTKVIQAEDKGIVRKINVANGSVVKEGDILIELDTVLTEADVSLLEKQRGYYELNLARLYAERDKKRFTPPQGASRTDVIEQQVNLFNSRAAELQSKIDVLKEHELTAKAELNNSLKRHEKYVQIYPIIAEQKSRAETLVGDGTMSLFEYQNYQQREIEIKQDMLSAAEEVKRARHTVQEQEKELRRVKNEWDSDIAAMILDSQRQLLTIEEDLVKAKEKHRLSRISSPIDGVVQQLEVHTIGAVLSPAQPIMLIVPADSPIEFEIWLDNKDIGFVHAGQSAEIKVETFGFQRYGTLDAIVKSVAAESKQDETRGLIYQAFLISSRDYFIVGDQRVPLMSGMAVTGEIKIRQKRIIQYFLDTFRTYISESMREP